MTKTSDLPKSWNKSIVVQWDPNNRHSSQEKTSWIYLPSKPLCPRTIRWCIVVTLSYQDLAHKFVQLQSGILSFFPYIYKAGNSESLAPHLPGSKGDREHEGINFSYISLDKVSNVMPFYSSLFKQIIVTTFGSLHWRQLHCFPQHQLLPFMLGPNFSPNRKKKVFQKGFRPLLCCKYCQPYTKFLLLPCLC